MRSDSKVLNIFWFQSVFLTLSFVLSIKIWRCSILCPNSISFLLSDYLLRDSIFQIIFSNKGIMSSLTCACITASFMHSFFFSLPKEFVTYIKKAIVGNSYKNWSVFLIIFLLMEFYNNPKTSLSMVKQRLINGLIYLAYFLILGVLFV